jgi:hypothetical protein
MAAHAPPQPLRESLDAVAGLLAGVPSAPGMLVARFRGLGDAGASGRLAGIAGPPRGVKVSATSSVSCQGLGRCPAELDMQALPILGYT